MDDLHIEYESTPAAWCAYFDPEGYIGRGKTREEAITELLEYAYEAWGAAVDERNAAKRSLSEEIQKRKSLQEAFDATERGRLNAIGDLRIRESQLEDARAQMRAHRQAHQEAQAKLRDRTEYAEQCRELLEGWCNTLLVETPADGLMKGKFCLFYKPGKDHKYGLLIAGNSYDECALNSIMGLLEHSRAALSKNTTPFSAHPASGNAGAKLTPAETVRYDPAPECKGEIAARERLEPEGHQETAGSGDRRGMDAQYGVTAGETAFTTTAASGEQPAFPGVCNSEAMQQLRWVRDNFADELGEQGHSALVTAIDLLTPAVHSQGNPT